MPCHWTIAAVIGAREGGRLPGLRVTSAALYTELRGQSKLVEKTGFEPAKIAMTWALPSGSLLV
jgi:hypothetical protein